MRRPRNRARSILTESGENILVDQVDYRLLTQFKWILNDEGIPVTMMRSTSGTVAVPMPDMILNPETGWKAVYKTENLEDNRRRNLMIVSE